ncbi:hypothetical protein K8I28_09335 [bacterium]|nr:hypothetical protein [bacterium]
MKVRGTVLISVQGFIKHKFGFNKYQLWLEEIPESLKHMYTSVISPDGWYELDPALTQANIHLCKLFYNESIHGSWECGRYSADLAATKFMKMFVRLGSTSLLLRRAKEVLPRYYMPSNIEIGGIDSTSASFSITHFPHMDKYIEARIGGWLERALEINGKKEVAVIINKSLVSGDSETRYDLSWK